MFPLQLAQVLKIRVRHLDGKYALASSLIELQKARVYVHGRFLQSVRGILGSCVAGFYSTACSQDNSWV
ncbi:Uncharacterised protein [Chlamydia trachomatis]|nr:Uncharacterised protein [Chlamydia trachomatis]